MASPNPKRSAKTPGGTGISPQQQRKRAQLYRKLIEAIDQGFASQALTKLAEVEKRFPTDVNVHVITGRAHASLGRHPEAIAAFARAVKLQPNDFELRHQYGAALHKGGELDQALIEFERVLYMKPDHFYALRHKASTLTDLGREPEAFKAFQALEELSKGMTLDPSRELAIAISGARFAPKLVEAQEAIDKIERCIRDSNETPFKKAGFFQLGRLYNHLDQHDNAFDAYKSCKEVDVYEWDPDEHSKRVDKLINCWRTDQEIPFSNAKGVDGSRLIFIVGMMRSGTSLTEQMLAQVKEIVPGGEMNCVSRSIPKAEVMTMKHAQRYPLDRSLYTQRQINQMSRQAMEGYNEVHRHFAVTDKQPYNYAYVPLIAHLFPGCKIIHCVRDPLDCCLSNFTQAFARPHPQTHNLYWLGRYFADYERTCQAWHDIPEVDMIDLQYEELVDDPEGQSKRVMEFLGREWTEDILEFHKSKRTVNTASRDQVRKKIYTSSVKKYAPYEHRLDELKRGIEEGRARPHGGSKTENVS
ncbi:MAG: sulfotransferase [Phycisphaerales bacterium]|nr:sulfotransferase [Phycisphaerales bacterium]